MLYTVTGLSDDVDDPIVAPDVPMPDDGTGKRFAKAFIYDEIPWMEVDHEVRDLMFLSVPDIDVPQGELSFADDDAVLDDMESCWFQAPAAEVCAPPYQVPEMPVSIAAPSETFMIPASAEVPLLTASDAEPEPIEEAISSAVDETVRGLVRSIAIDALDAPYFEMAVESEVERTVEEFIRPMALEYADAPYFDMAVASEVERTVEELVRPMALDHADAPYFEMAVESEVERTVEELVAAIAEEAARAASEAVRSAAIAAAIVESRIGTAVSVPSSADDAVDIAADDVFTVTEQEAFPVGAEDILPAVVFSFGSREARGNGWKVCFSF